MTKKRKVYMIINTSHIPVKVYYATLSKRKLYIMWDYYQDCVDAEIIESYIDKPVGDNE